MFFLVGWPKTSTRPLFQNLRRRRRWRSRGTAGLRAEVGAGPLRMNRLVVRQAAAGLADWLLAHVADASHRGVVIGYDARRKSELFALDTAYVLAARGIRSMVFSSVVPTPVLAWSITELGAA